MWDKLKYEIANSSNTLKKVNVDEINSNKKKASNHLGALGGSAVNKILARRANLAADSSDSESDHDDWD